MEEPTLNAHNKDEFPPAHTAEHILNQTMVRTFSCARSRINHIERKKSKCNYDLDFCPTEEQIRAVEAKVNEIISQDLPVVTKFVSRNELPPSIDISRLPDDASETIRLVRIGEYDVCPCIGKHVRSTSQIGRFEMLGPNWDEVERSFRVRFKIIS